MNRSRSCSDASRALAIACSIALLGACVPAATPAVVAPEPVSRVPLVARVLAMADSRLANVPLLDSALLHPSPDVRRVAASAAGNLRARSAAPRLAELARDPDARVARVAAFALALLRDTASVDRLDSLVGAPNSEVARGAAWGLGELGEPARAAIARRLSRAPEQSPAALAELLLAAARLRPVPAPLVAPLLAHPDTTVEWAAAYALARSRVPEGARALLARTSSRSALTRAYVARGLARGTTGDTLASLALPALRALAGDPHPHVRIAAARALASFGAESHGALLTLARDRDANVRIAAVQALPPQAALARAALDSLWSADTGLTYRAGVLAAAVRSQRALLWGEAWNADSDWRRRAAAVEARAALPMPLAVEALRPAARDGDGRVRAAAISALGGFADSATVADSVLPVLRAALTDTDWQVRAAAISALGRRPRAADALAAAELLRDSRARDDAGDAGDARLAALGLLRSLWARDSAAVPAAAVTTVRALPAPADRLERQAVTSSTLFSHWSAPPDGTPRPLAWYEDVAQRLALADVRPVAVIRTSRGVIELELFAGEAPLTVENFVRLAKSGYYRNTTWHRVVPAFVAQDGDPRGDGSGGPGYAIRDEQNPWRYDRGVLGMALSGPDTGGSQYFITLSPQPHLDGHYTVFGRVLRGLEVLDALVQGDSVLSVDVR